MKNRYLVHLLVISFAAFTAMTPAASLAAEKSAVPEAAETEKTGQAAEEEGAQEKEKEDAGTDDAQAPREGRTSENDAPEAESEAATGEQQEPEQQQENADPSTSMADALNTQRTMVADDDILMIRIGYMFEDGSFDEWLRGTGFVVGNRYILTRQILADTTTQNAIYQKILKERGESYRRIGVNLSNEAETQKHMRSLITDIDGKDIDVTDVSLRNGLALVVTKDVIEVPAVVFADAKKVNLVEKTVVNIKSAANADDRCVVNTFQGVITVDEEQESGYSFRAEGNTGHPVGAPVYDKNGHIIGMVSGEGDLISCFTIKSLETFLSTNGVQFRTIEQIEAEGEAFDKELSESDVNEAESAVANKDALSVSIERASAVKAGDYTKETYDALLEALDEAVRTEANLEADQEEVDRAEQKLNAAFDALESRGFFRSIYRVLSSVGTLVLTAIGVFIGLLIYFLTAGRKLIAGLPGAFKKTKEKGKENKRISEELDVDITRRPPGKKKRKPGDYDPGIKYREEEAKMGRLDVEDDGSGDTIYLKKDAYLERVENGKVVQITKNDFMIGKERKKVDYCISGNPTVSRQHCTVSLIEGSYYIEDNDSANYTLVNGKRIKPYTKALIEDGDEITLSNEKFIFHRK